MAKDVESTMQWKLDIAQFKANITDAKRQIALANAEFKTATAGTKGWADSITGCEAKVKQLSTVSSQQKTVLSELEKQYAVVAREQGENSEAAQKLKLQIENQKAAIAKTDAQLDQYTDRLDKLEQEQAQSETTMGKLSKTIEEQEKAVASLKDEYANAVLTYGKNSDEAKELGNQLNELSSELAQNKRTMSEAEQAADELDNSMEGVEDSTEKAQGGFTVMKGVLADLIASGIRVAIQAFKDLGKAAIESYKEFDDGADTVIKATGATGTAAEGLVASYKNVTKSVLGDFNDLGAALGEISTRFGFTGSDLENATIKFQKFSDVTGTDATEAVRLVSRAMGDAGIENEKYGELLDQLTVASQSSGVELSKLTDSIAKYGAPMRALGFDTNETIAMFAKWEKTGVNTEIAFSGMKKAISNWSKDGKDARVEFKKTLDEIKATPDIASATTKAIEVFGAKAGPDLADAIKGGRFEYEEFLSVLQNSEGSLDTTYDSTIDGVDELKLALQGMRAEMGATISEFIDTHKPEVDKAIEGLKTGFNALMATIQFIIDYGGIIVSVLGGLAAAVVAYELAVNGATIAQNLLNTAMSLNPIGLIIAAIVGLIAAFVLLWNNSEEFRNFWIGLWDAIKQAAASVIDFCVTAFTQAWEWIKQVWAEAQPYFLFIWECIKAYFSVVKEYLGGAFKTAWEYIKLVWSVVTGYFKAIWETIKGIFAVVKAVLSGDFQGAWEAIKGIVGTWVSYFSGIWEQIKRVFSSASSWFGNTFSAAWSAIKNVFSGWGDFFGGLWGRIKEKFSSIGTSISSAISGAVRSGINGVISAIQSTINGGISIINGAIGMINKIPGVSIGRMDKLSLPRLAQGGVLANGARAIIAGEDGAEAIVPLEKNTQWIAKVAKDLLEQLKLADLNSTVKSGIAGLTNNITNATGGLTNNTQNVIFNQTIQSPKAIDRLTLYRETNSMLFNAKVRLANV